MITPTFQEFYGIIRDAVRFYPINTDAHPAPKAFAVIDGPEQINEENLGRTIADYHKPYFWSRAWEAAKFHPSKVSFSYPLVYAWEDKGMIETPFSFRSGQERTLYLGAVVQMADKQTGDLSIYGKPILFPEIIDLAGEYIYNVMRYITDVGLFFVDGKKKWLHQNHAQYLLDSGKASNVVKQVSQTSAFHAHMKNTPDLELFIMQGHGKDKVSGLYTAFSYRRPVCDVPEYVFNEANCCVEYDR